MLRKANSQPNVRTGHHSSGACSPPHKLNSPIGDKQRRTVRVLVGMQKDPVRYLLSFHLVRRLFWSVPTDLHHAIMHHK